PSFETPCSPSSSRARYEPGMRRDSSGKQVHDLQSLAGRLHRWGAGACVSCCENRDREPASAEGPDGSPRPQPVGGLGMTAAGFGESAVEDAALGWLEAAGWNVANGPSIAPDMPAAERADFGETLLGRRLHDALCRLNPELPAEAIEDAHRKLIRPEGTDLVQRNRAFHRLLVDGVTVEYRAANGAIRGAQARVLDFEDPACNDWLAVNQFAVVE